MRIALRIVSAVTILCIPLGLAFIFATGSTGGDVSPLLLPGFRFIGLGVLLAITTMILGMVVIATRRQFAWLVAVTVAALVPFIGIPVVEILASQLDPETGSALAGTAFPALLLGGPILIALVVLIYSFRLREPAAVGAFPRATAPLR